MPGFMGKGIFMSKRKLSTKPYKGTRDFYPDEMRLRNWIFGKMSATARSFGYEEYDGPMLEAFELYAAKSGEELVNEQLYHFTDRGDRRVAIRPEMTPTVARMVAARLQQLARPIRWFSIPNLWRYERPQRGRLREHWQFNVDIFGVNAIAADLEIIEIAIRVMTAMNAPSDTFQIHISNRRMLNYFLNEILDLDQNGASVVSRAMDKKGKLTPGVFQDMLTQAGLSLEKINLLEEFMNLSWDSLKSHPIMACDGAKELQSLWEGLSVSGLSEYCSLDLSIVRGLDYYTGTVFEMFDLHPDNRRALFGGGRYDDLVGLFTDVKIPGVGFGMGDVTVQDFLTVHDLLPEIEPPVHIFIALIDESSLWPSMDIARKLRDAGLSVSIQIEPAKIAKQFKMADQQSIPIVLVQGPDEREKNQVTLKHLASREQVTIPMQELVATIRNWNPAT